MAPVPSKERVGAVAGTLKSSRSHRSHVTSVVIVAIARSSTLALKQETVVCFLVFQAIKEAYNKPRGSDDQSDH